MKTFFWILSAVVVLGGGAAAVWYFFFRKPVVKLTVNTPGLASSQAVFAGKTVEQAPKDEAHDNRTLQVKTS